MMIEKDNIQQKLAFDMIARTDSSFFLTGRAGTGKTTFLKNVQESIDKNFLVLASTGVAAINAGGQTIHSFFGFHFGVLGPGEYGTMNPDKISIVRTIDTIIVDEVSMVRCDIVDAMDRTLRRIRHSSVPFGGIQMIFVGDPFQLEPVIPASDKVALESIYGHGPYYFYNSAVLSHFELPKIEFIKIYRQDDQRFVELLEHVRTNKVTSEDISLINSRYNPNAEQSVPYSIVLTSTRTAAQKINSSNLEKLKGKLHTFEARFTGDCKACRDSVEETLALKVGAQVMFTKNDQCKRWVNGTIAKVVSLEEGKIEVELESGERYNVPMCVWENSVYTYDKKTKTCEKEVRGKATQFPLRLAWAITIHKSQSLTFEHVAVDFGYRAFAAGQAYVALSRAKSLEGLVLLSPFSPSSIQVSASVAGFAADYNDETLLSYTLTAGEIISTCGRGTDYDTVAKKLFTEALGRAEKGEIALAEILLDKAMSVVADDACLAGTAWHGKTESKKINAFGLFYSGDVDGALDELGKMGRSIMGDFNCLYLRSRCYEEMEEWGEVEEDYMHMISIYDSVCSKGVDSSSFRKFRYRLAILNESHYGDPGAGVMRALITENPAYDKYHIAIRPMLWNCKEAQMAQSKLFADNEIIALALDSSVEDETFVKRLAIERNSRSGEWRDYLRFLSKLNLEMAC